MCLVLVFLYLEKRCVGIICVHQCNLLGPGAVDLNQLYIEFPHSQIFLFTVNNTEVYLS